MADKQQHGMPGWLKILLVVFIVYVGINALTGPSPMQQYMPASQTQQQPEAASNQNRAPETPLKSDTEPVPPVAVNQPKILDVKRGNGAGPIMCGQEASIYYDGFLKDRTRFDTNQNASKPLTFTIGAGEVIRGLELGVLGMQVGTVRKLTVPPALAFDDKAFSNDAVPAGSELSYELRLVKLEPVLPAVTGFGTKIFLEHQGSGKPAQCGDSVMLEVALFDTAGKGIVDQPLQLSVQLGRDALPVGLLQAAQAMRIDEMRIALIIPEHQKQWLPAGGNKPDMLSMFPQKQVVIATVTRKK